MRATAGPGEPRGHEKQDSDPDEPRERPAEQVGEDVPGVRGRRFVLRLHDELVHHVVPADADGDETDHADDDDDDPDPAHRTAPVAGDPDREREGGEREQREHPGQGLEDVDAVLRRLELVRAQDLDLADVFGNLVCDLVAEADAICGFEDDHLQIQRDRSLVGRHRVAAALEHGEQGLVRLVDRQRPQPLQTGLLQRPLDQAVGGLAQGGGSWTGEALVVVRELLLELCLDVDGREELIDRSRGDRRSDLVVLDELGARIDEDLVVQHHAIDPHGRGCEEQEQSR